METFKPKFTGMSFHNMDGIGWPDSVVVDNGGSVLEGTYESMTYTPERTCKNADKSSGWFCCSECSKSSLDRWPTYCPNCGAKVVE